MPKLYELCGAETDRLFSAYAWRVRLTLGYKGIAFDSQPLPFTAIPGAVLPDYARVPVFVDGDETVVESFDICHYLEARHPDTPTVFGGEGGVQNAALIDNLIVTGLYPTISRMIIKDIHDQLAAADQAYFRASREERFGATLEDVQRGRDKERTRFATFLKPYRRRLEAAPYLGGERLLFADIALCASLCWARATSPYDILGGDALMDEWFWRTLDACHGRAALKRA
ncbi:MAG: glutathione S-transferase N-terminal domain-containing protein [Devosiaceae bacterium]|nr:glutathione S-transferase N-terminal domain-containing protein [Devosiaceae bacterium MH13]